MNLKVIDYLDACAVRWLAASPLMFIGFGPAKGIAVSLAGGRCGFVEVVDPSRMRLLKSFLDDPEHDCEGHGFGALCLIPGLGETLRINGRVDAVDRDAIEIRVEECYVHCAKALIRSAFWSVDPGPTVPSEAAEFFAASRFLALVTVDSNGRADVSPKGDPAGLMIRLSEGAAWFPDRPGNRRADGFRNILTQRRVAAAVLIPGATGIARVDGEARITKNEQIRKGFAAHEKVPRLVVSIEQPTITIVDSPALKRAQLWPMKRAEKSIDPAATLVAHVNLNKQAGLQAKLIRAVLSVPGLMRNGLDRDYRTNLY
jgi:predicted pyridoxine 5'-phosphate oxidase superfamily flavin-nucleotide-binding protein